MSLLLLLQSSGPPPDPTGDGAASLAALTASATGSVAVAGAASAALPALTASASGGARPEGTAGGTLPALTASASGHASVAGTASATVPSLTATATGTALLLSPATGSGAATLPMLTASASGTAATDEEPSTPGRVDDWSDVEPLVWHRPAPVVRVDGDAFPAGITVRASVGEVLGEGEADAWAAPVAVATRCVVPEARGARNLPDDVLVAMLLTV